MNHVVVAKAFDEVVPTRTVIIDICESVPTGMTRSEYEAFYAEQAEAIANALYDTLPNATFQRVVANLIMINASIYCGRYTKTPTSGKEEP